MMLMSFARLPGDVVSHYDVDLKEMPELPITWHDTPELKYYAQALQSAIEDRIITSPGKYRIQVIHNMFTEDRRYNIFVIIEPKEES
jgi:hypothetical protein